MSTARAENPRVGTVRFRDADGEIIGLPRRIAHNAADAESDYTLDKLYAMFLSESPELEDYFKEAENG